MKKILFIGIVLSVIGCGSSDKDCNCTQQKWQRTAVYTVATPQTLVSSSEWEKTGGTESTGTDDCSQNGNIKSDGSANATPIPGTGNYSRTEYEYRVTCQ